MTHSKPTQIVGLDILRFLAASGVLFFHFVYLIGLEGHTPYRITHGEISFPFLSGIAQFGWIGVEVFFLISGFVISMSAASASPRKFFEGRVLRLVPCAWICASITFIVALLIHDGSVLSIVARYVRSLSFFPIGNQIDGSYWTLGVEIAFYAVVWMMLFLKQWHRFFMFICGLAVVSTVYNLSLLFGDEQYQFYSRITDLLLLRHGCEFAFGALIYVMKSSGVTMRSVIFAAIAMVGCCAEIPVQYLAHTHNVWVAADFEILMILWAVCVIVF